MKQLKLEGAMTALITPFTADGALDAGAFRRIVRAQIAGGIHGLVPLGTTGESPTIEDGEREQILRIAVSEAKAAGIPVIAGTGTNSTKKTIRATAQAQELGADAALIVSPYYNKPTQEGLYQHFAAVANAVDLPIVVYNIKGRTGVNIETPTLARLAKLQNIVAVKEASGDLSQMADVLSVMPKDFSVLSGDDGLTLPLMSLGGRGVISVVSNLLPEKVAKMVDAALAGDFATARALHFELLPIFRAAFLETNPIPIKTAMALAGHCTDTLRLPMCAMQPQNREKLAAVLRQAGVLQ